MAYGDKISFGEIKDCSLFYRKPNERDFKDNWITIHLYDKNGYSTTLEFKNRKHWFKFVRKINLINKKIKRKNIELLQEE